MPTMMNKAGSSRGFILREVSLRFKAQRDLGFLLRESTWLQDFVREGGDCGVRVFGGSCCELTVDPWPASLNIGFQVWRGDCRQLSWKCKAGRVAEYLPSSKRYASLTE